MKTIYTILMSGLISFTVNAQVIDRSVINTNGGSFTGTDFSIDYAIGEVAVGTIESGGYVVTQGFIQPDVIIGQGESVDIIESDENVTIYPNPAQNDLYIKIKDIQGNKIKIQFIDITGKVRLEEKAEVESENQEIKLDIKQLTNGIYFVTVLVDDELVKRTKIYKK